MQIKRGLKCVCLAPVNNLTGKGNPVYPILPQNVTHGTLKGEKIRNIYKSQFQIPFFKWWQLKFFILE